MGEGDVPPAFRFGDSKLLKFFLRPSSFACCKCTSLGHTKYLWKQQILLSTHIQHGESPKDSPRDLKSKHATSPRRRELTVTSPSRGYIPSLRRLGRSFASFVSPLLEPRKLRLLSVRTSPMPTSDTMRTTVTSQSRTHLLMIEPQISSIKRHKRSARKMAKSTPRWRISLTSSPNPRRDTFFSATH